MDFFESSIPEKIPQIIRFSHQDLRCNKYQRFDVYYLKRMYENSNNWDLLDITRVHHILKSEGINVKKNEIKKMPVNTEDKDIWNRIIRFEILVDSDISNKTFEKFDVGEYVDYMTVGEIFVADI
jgi:hypothetical protein